MSYYTDRENVAILKNKKIQCRYCGKVMYVDDIDYNFKGCYDIYFGCQNCNTSCIQETRFNQVFKEHWHSENDEVKDEHIKYHIKR